MSAPSSFDLKTPLAPSRVLRTLHERLSRPRPLMSGVVADGRVDLFVPPERQHHWSPQLIVDIEPHVSERGSILRCRYCSHPHVWALRMALVGIATISLLISGCVSYAQWAMEQAPTALLALPLITALGVTLRYMGHPERGYGAAQEKELQQFLEGEVFASERQQSSVPVVPSHSAPHAHSAPSPQI